MNEPRPTYWQIVLAYLQEGYRAWQERDTASGASVERHSAQSLTTGSASKKNWNDSASLRSKRP